MKAEMPRWPSWTEIRSLIYRRPWSILSWSSGVIAVAFIGYFGILSLGNPTVNLGQQFVLAEWPDPKISPYFYAKPITWFSYASFLYWTFGLEAQKARFLKFSDRTRRLLFITTACIAFGAFYEIFFNFMLWSALEVLTQNCFNPPCNPDLLVNKFPLLRNPINLVFATKVVTLVFGLGVYSLWFLHRVEKETERGNQTLESISPREELYPAGPMKAEQIIPSRSLDIERKHQTMRESAPSYVV